MTVAVVLAYLALVLVVGVTSQRWLKGTGEDYFLASRSIGPFLLLMSLFGTHMTAFSLLGASGESYRTGVGVFSLMASSSALVVPAVFLGVGVRLWEVGKRHGFVTQIQFFRQRWGSDALALVLFVALVALLVPYLLIGVLGGGVTLEEISGGALPRWLGSLLVAGVVTVYVSTGGLRGTAWANTFQTLVFMTLGAAAFVWIVRDLGGLGTALRAVDPSLLVHGERIPAARLLSYTLIPLSVGMFPHIFMHWLTARSRETFRLPAVAYPLCIAIVWVPSVLLGVLGSVSIPGLAGPAANGVLVRMIDAHAPELLGGLLAAGVCAAIMSSLDSQVLSLATLFTHDVAGRHRGSAVGDDARRVRLGRAFVVGILALVFGLSLVAETSIFRLGIWSFTGFAALFPLPVAALYWRRSTAAGALASVVVAALLWALFFVVAGDDPGYSVAGTGLLPVAVILPASALTLVVVSLVTRPPAAERVERFFS